MKKCFVLFLVSVMIFSLISCKKAPPEESTETTAETTAETKGSYEASSEDTEPEPSETVTEKETDEEPAMPEMEPEAPLEEAYLGDWYALVKGMSFLLTFSDDGSYAAGFPALYGDPEVGSWKLESGSIVLNENEEDRILILDEGLLRSERLDADFTREKVEDYTPDELITDTETGDFSGYWTSAFVQTADGVVPAENVGEYTDIYIEGTTAALGGDLFRDVIHEFSHEGNALILSLTDAEKTFTVKLELQIDGFMRMTVSSGGSEELVVYLQYEGGEELLTGIPDEEVPSYDDEDEEEEDGVEAEASADE